MLQRQIEVGMECAKKGRRDGLTIIIKKKMASTTDSRFLMHIIENHKLRDDIQRLAKLHRFGNGEADGRSLTIS